MEPAATERTPVQSVQNHAAQTHSTPRGRRPATMGKSIAEQAYLANAANRAKHGG
ncbi:hypothetical protein [Enhygromyxa salina]|uniref:Uncharacterized protein n=1 Tax=Enhygromyxa salina TaxID=215803 RepID=A0A2S9XL90_9BACT|nr:hypothetical protein [Enhygromyxa salina]PRP93607.1 hypothetical protein ENSA7_80350 [Enhygromyxa salina]